MFFLVKVKGDRHCLTRTCKFLVRFFPVFSVDLVDYVDFGLGSDNFDFDCVQVGSFVADRIVCTIAELIVAAGFSQTCTTATGSITPLFVYCLSAVSSCVCREMYTVVGLPFKTLLTVPPETRSNATGWTDGAAYTRVFTLYPTRINQLLWRTIVL